MMGGTGAASALALAVAACGSSSSSSSTSTAAPASTGTKKKSSSKAGGDIDIVNYALTLEYLEAQFYKDAEGTGFFKGAQLDLIKNFGATEQMHVDALKATVTKLGGTPAAKPNAKFPLDSATSIVKLAQRVENLGAAAYLGQAGNIQSPDILAAALSIHSVEARHAATLNGLLGKDITPTGAFAKPATMDEVLAIVKPFIQA